VAVAVGAEVDDAVPTVGGTAGECGDRCRSGGCVDRRRRHGGQWAHERRGAGDDTLANGPCCDSL
jgi:hypothetical protein